MPRDVEGVRSEKGNNKKNLFHLNLSYKTVPKRFCTKKPLVTEAVAPD